MSSVGSPSSRRSWIGRPIQVHGSLSGRRDTAGRAPSDGHGGRVDDRGVSGGAEDRVADAQAKQQDQRRRHEQDRRKPEPFDRQGGIAVDDRRVQDLRPAEEAVPSRAARRIARPGRHREIWRPKMRTGANEGGYGVRTTTAASPPGWRATWSQGPMPPASRCGSQVAVAAQVAMPVPSKRRVMRTRVPSERPARSPGSQPARRPGDAARGIEGELLQDDCSRPAAAGRSRAPAGRPAPPRERPARSPAWRARSARRAVPNHVPCGPARPWWLLGSSRSASQTKSLR